MKTLVFHHLPKTGAHTLATALASAFPIGTTDIIGADVSEGFGYLIFKNLIDNKNFVECHIFPGFI